MSSIKKCYRHFVPRKSPVRAKNLCHNGACAGHFLELPGRYQSSRERQNSVPRKRCDLTLEGQQKKGRSSNVSTSNFLLSIYEVRKERKSVFLDVTIKTTKVNRKVKLLCSKKKIMTCCLSCHFIKVPRLYGKNIEQIPSKDPPRVFTVFSNQSQADKTKTGAIDISIHPNESPSTVQPRRTAKTAHTRRTAYLLLVWEIWPCAAQL